MSEVFTILNNSRLLKPQTFKDGKLTDYYKSNDTIFGSSNDDDSKYYTRDYRDDRDFTEDFVKTAEFKTLAGGGHIAKDRDPQKNN